MEKLIPNTKWSTRMCGRKMNPSQDLETSCKRMQRFWYILRFYARARSFGYRPQVIFLRINELLVESLWLRKVQWWKNWFWSSYDMKSNLLIAEKFRCKKFINFYSACIFDSTLSKQNCKLSAYMGCRAKKLATRAFSLMRTYQFPLVFLV